LEIIIDIPWHNLGFLIQYMRFWNAKVKGVVQAKWMQRSSANSSNHHHDMTLLQIWKLESLVTYHLLIKLFEDWQNQSSPLLLCASQNWVQKSIQGTRKLPFPDPVATDNPW
jgi:hypothetical protein